jgi:hypothetical protein
VSRREAVASAVVVFAAALLVRVYAASLVVFPKPEDTAYYVDVARNVLAGRGLVSDSLWSFGTQPLVVPREAFEVWLPMPTLAALVPMALLGATFAAAQASSVVIGALVPVLAWRLAADVATERALPPGRARTLAVGTGITAAVSLPLILHSTLPDSTMPFAVLTLGACLLIARIRRAGDAAADDPDSGPGPARTDRRPPARPLALLVGLGAVLGAAALTRNEAAWLALAWVWFAIRLPVAPRERIALVAIPAVVALAIFAPWMVRDWLVFGSPLPGQALTNALSIAGPDIFAWSDPPTVSRYLAVGVGRLVEMRAVAIEHNLFEVLLFPGAPLSVLGLLTLPWILRLRSLQPLTLASAVIFVVTSLLFPVATTWGTFLHAAGAVHVLLVIAALLALDRLIVWVGARRGWTRPVAWLAPALTISGAALFTAVLLPTFGGGSVATARMFEVLDRELATAGVGPESGLHSEPMITDAPIWLPYVAGGTALALPHEPAASVLDLARHFLARTVIVVDPAHPFPTALASGGPEAACFVPVTLRRPADPTDARAIAGVRVYRIVCP